MPEFKKPSVTATVVVFRRNADNLFVLLGKRSPNSDAYPNMWCLPGGFLDVDEETTEDCAVRELREETGLMVDKERLTLFHVSSHPETDPRCHVVNVCYKLYLTDYECRYMNAADDISELEWRDAFSIQPLAFDHNDILNRAIGITR